MTTNRRIASISRSLRFLMMASLLAPAAFAGSAVDRDNLGNPMPLAAPATHYSVTSSTIVPLSVPLTVTVTALDASNASATGYNGTVHFTSSSDGTLPADYTFVAGDNGTHTFSVILTSAGPQTITATDTANASINGTDTVSTIPMCPPGPAPYAMAMNNGPACAGGSVTLFASGSGGVFSWTGPGGFTSTQRSPTVTVAGVYAVTVTDPGPCGGSAWASTTVVINPNPAATITTGGTACALSSGNLASLVNAGAGATYLWSITNGTITGGMGTRSITYDTGGTGSAQLAVTVTANGCSADGTAGVAINFAPSITKQPAGQIVSPGSHATFTVAAAGGDLHYQWFVRHPSNMINPVGTDSPSFTTHPESNASWFARITNACGTVDSVEVGAQVGTPRHRASH